MAKRKLNSKTEVRKTASPTTPAVALQLRRVTVAGLFNTFDYDITFPTPSEEVSQPSVVILHGRNGVGKTTLLRMLDGMMRLDFNTFRRVPFRSCTLSFTSGDSITVAPKIGSRGLEYLEVKYREHSALLHPERSGSLSEKEAVKVEEFRNAFFESTQTISFEFINTERMYQVHLEEPDPSNAAFQQEFVVASGQGRYQMHAVSPRHFVPVPRNPKAKDPGTARSLAERVAHFIRDAQVNYRRFFSATEPDLFARIIEGLTAAPSRKVTADAVKTRLSAIHSQDLQTSRLGLEPDRWDYKQLVAQLDSLANKKGSVRQHALTVLASYAEVLESRAAERHLVAERLFTFERLLTAFFVDKTVSPNASAGILIRTRAGQLLKESQLSSGEFHLLFLMVAALVTRRRGTVIAIDEPEMSMHIGWQRKLVPALVECASKAQPLFILATHSPDIAATYPDAMVELAPPASGE
jgi:ABC-type cobalamin/Fe3+-siderophores transport system ATPase subunit